MKKLYFGIFCFLVAALLCFVSCAAPLPAEGGEKGEESSFSAQEEQSSFSDWESIPAYSGAPYVVIHENVPFFEMPSRESLSFEHYGNLDEMGRCTAAIANIGKDLMPTEPRGAIGQIKPSGWQTVKYDCVDGKYLYNRCHLIGYQLTAENANEKNLVTGTRYLNVIGMLPFENMVADFIKETENHVLYRVTPYFAGEELVCRGILMEARSVEDGGEGIQFCVYCYNVQPQIQIDYATGESAFVGGEAENPPSSDEKKPTFYILNTNSKKFHLPNCKFAASIRDDNRQESILSRELILLQGYEPCKTCNP